MAPAGATSLMLEVPCDKGDALWTANEDALYARCMDDLSELGLTGLRQRTRAYFSSFVPEGYPIYHLGYREDRDAVLGSVSDCEGIRSCGRQGSFRYVFMDAAMQMGIDAARSLASGTRMSAAPPDGSELLEGKVFTA
jgi:protoporphyrinogen oxidase